MAFRLLRICSSPELFENRLCELKNDVLVPRGYKDSVIEVAFEKVRRMTRAEALKKTDKKEKSEKNKDRIVNPFDYNPRTPVIGPVKQTNITGQCSEKTTV